MPKLQFLSIVLPKELPRLVKIERLRRKFLAANIKVRHFLIWKCFLILVMQTRSNLWIYNKSHNKLITRLLDDREKEQKTKFKNNSNKSVRFTYLTLKGVRLFLPHNGTPYWFNRLYVCRHSTRFQTPLRYGLEGVPPRKNKVTYIISDSKWLNIEAKCGCSNRKSSIYLLL